MTGARSLRRNPYRPGTASYARVREDTLTSRAALTQATAAPGEMVVIHVTATDRPGHSVTKTVHLAILAP